MHFLVYSRAAASAVGEHDPALDEEHWSYMDGFTSGMVARGPLLATDRDGWRGSVHIVDLASAAAARAFAEREPYNHAGLFADHLIRRFENLLGRTMWEAPGASTDPRFFVVAHLVQGQTSARLLQQFTTLPEEHLIVHGALLTADDARPDGVALALQAATREDVDALLREGRPGLDEQFEIEIVDWELGGRR